MAKKVSKLLVDFLMEKDVAVHTNAEDYGFTEAGEVHHS